MSRYTLRAVHALLAAILVVCGTTFAPPVPAGAAEPVSPDDTLPGLALEAITGYSATVVGTLDPPPSAATTDSLDIYSVYLAQGEQLVVTLEGTAPDFDLRLWAPSTLDPTAPKNVYGFSTLGSSSERICYTASPKWGTGRYYVVVDARDLGAGDGSYTLRWNVSSRSDGNVPGVALTSNEVTGEVDALWDLDDVYRIAAAAGGTLSATLTADDPADSLKLQLFDALSGGVPTTDIYAGSAPSQHVGAVAAVTWDLTSSGTYYLAVSAEDAIDASYHLEWSYSGQDVPGGFLDSWTTARLVDSRQVIALDLVWGEQVHFSFTSPDGAVLTARLYAPGTLDPDTATPVLTDTTVMGAAGGDYVVPEGRDGTYYLAVDPVTPGTVLPDVKVGPGLRRLSGATRYETAVKTCASAFPGGSDVVIIASGQNFPDALAASGLAGAYGAPLLLTQRDTLPAVTRNEIVRLKATRAFVIGAEAAISSAVFAQIDAVIATTPVRLGGRDRYETAAEVAEQVRLRRGLLDAAGPARIGFVARGDSFPDALALAPLAWREAAPVYLVQPSAIPASTMSALSAGAPHTTLLIAGGDKAVSPAVAAQLGVYGTVERAWGDSRYGTAAAVARWGVAHGSASWRYIGVATGENYPDALAGGVAAGSAHGLLLLTPRSTLVSDTRTAIATRGQGTEWGRVFGGSSAVSDPVFGALNTYFAPPR